MTAEEAFITYALCDIDLIQHNNPFNWRESIKQTRQKVKIGAGRMNAVISLKSKFAWPASKRLALIPVMSVKTPEMKSK